MKRILCAVAAMLLVASSAYAQDREAVLDSLQYKGFLYFWEQANPTNGLVKDRSTSTSPASIAATGFGLSAICVGIDHGWVSRADGRARVLTTLETFWYGPQGSATSGEIGYKGLYYHFLDMTSAQRYVPFGSNNELSTIDTALLFAGILHAREYFSDANDPDETTIRALADSITWRADWDWARNGSPGVNMAWYPESGFSSGTWTGYCEAKIMYLLAIGSPTHGIPGAAAWSKWTSGYVWSQPYASPGPYVQFPSLFVHQYSECWIDFRGVQDAYMLGKGITYFENSRRAALTQMGWGNFYGSVNFEGVSDSLWGWTACDGPPTVPSGTGHPGYFARGMPNGYDDGTIAPTAPFSSYMFAPDSIWIVMRNMYDHWRGPTLWGRYGFTDAFNPKLYPWIDSDYLGIDQGPIVLGIENGRNNMVWARFMQNADIQRGLQLAGFTPVVNAVPAAPSSPQSLAFAAGPNPFRAATGLRFVLPFATRVRIALYDLQGRQVALVLDEDRAAGEYSFRFDGSRLQPGVYLARLEAAGRSVTRRVVMLP